MNIETCINKLVLSEKFVIYIFNTELSKNDLIYKIFDNDKNMYSNYFKCFKLHGGNINKYKIIFPYEKNNYSLIINVLKLIDSYSINRTSLINKSSILLISNNKCEELIFELTKLDYWKYIIFGKKFSTHKYNCISSMVGVKYVIYNGLWIENLENLPSNLEMIYIKIKFHKNLILNIPNKLKKILIKEKKKSQKYLFDFNELENIKKICIINNFLQIDLNKKKFEYLAYMCKNSYVNFTNLPSSIKALYLFDGFNLTLDYLPNTIVDIIFEGKICSNLSNLPSSIKNVKFNKMTDFNIYKINQLPDFIESLWLDCFGTQVQTNLIKLPLKIKKLYINTTNSYYNINSNLKIYTHKNFQHKLNSKCSYIINFVPTIYDMDNMCKQIMSI